MSEKELTFEQMVIYVSIHFERGFMAETDRHARLEMIKELVSLMPHAYLIGFMTSFQMMYKGKEE